MVHKKVFFTFFIYRFIFQVFAILFLV